MRPFLTTLLAVPLLLAADLAVQTTTANTAQAADFTGRIKRVRIRERADGRYTAVVVTENGPEEVERPGRLQVALEPIDGGPTLIPQADMLTERIEDLRFDVRLPTAELLAGVVIGINTTKGDAEVPLDALLEENEASFGAPVIIGNADEGDVVEVRARVEVDADGERLVELSVRARGEADLAGTTAKATARWADTREPFNADFGLLGAVRRHTLVFDVEDTDLNPGDYAYNLIGGWTFDDGATQDRSYATVDLDGTASGPRIHQVVLGETRRGDTRLVTRVSSPDSRPVVLEALVTSPDGRSVIALADEAPVWTEHQYRSTVQFVDDPTGATYPVSLVRYGADGAMLSEPVSLMLTAERPTLDDPFYDGTLFADGTAVVALLPASEDTWQIVVHAVSDGNDDDETSSVDDPWHMEFNEPFEGPSPEFMRVPTPLDEVWHQFRQVARGTAPSGDAMTVGTTISDADGTVAAQAGGSEIEGAVVNGDRAVDDVDVFIQELAANPGSAKKRIRHRAIHRVRR